MRLARHFRRSGSVGFTTFPGEVSAAHELGRAVLPHLTYFNKVDRGGQFVAWEEPELFDEVRADSGH